MDDNRFAAIVSDPKVLKKTFDWEGTSYEEDAANEFFMRSFQMFNLTETSLGKGGDYSFLKGVSKVGEVDEGIQAKINLLKDLIPGGAE